MASQLTHELNTLRAERNQMLEGLEALGWPCRLVELPAYAMKSDREIDRLRAALDSISEIGVSARDDVNRHKLAAVMETAKRALCAGPSSDETSDG